MPNHSNADLKAKNYLNSSELVIANAFDFCPSYSPRDKIGAKYGAVTLSKSRMQDSEGVEQGAGGSERHHLCSWRLRYAFFLSSFHTFQTQHTNDHVVSACHGAGDDPISPPCYPSRFFQWWNTVFPHPATELTNGALRRTNSGYFGYCNSHHLPD